MGPQTRGPRYISVSMYFSGKYERKGLKNTFQETNTAIETSLQGLRPEGAQGREQRPQGARGDGERLALPSNRKQDLSFWAQEDKSRDLRLILLLLGLAQPRSCEVEGRVLCAKDDGPGTSAHQSWRCCVYPPPAPRIFLMGGPRGGTVTLQT